MGEGIDIRTEVARLKSLQMAELRVEYERLYQEPCRSSNRVHLVRRICWRLAHPGPGLSPAAIARAREIAAVSPVRLHATRAFADEVRRVMETPVPSKRDPRLPAVGTAIVRQYRGETISVLVTDRGFEWRGETYPSLSAVATAISGSHVNGFRFFRLGPKEERA